MLYAPSELSAELGVALATIREWVRHDLPHDRDANGRIWIKGYDLANWVKAKRTSQPLPALEDNQAYCFHCRVAIVVKNPRRRQQARRISLSGECPRCGAAVNRGVRYGQ
jgi:hypothetical protein